MRRLLGRHGDYTDVRPRPAPARTKGSTRGATPALLLANGRFGVDRDRRRADDSPRIRAQSRAGERGPRDTSRGVETGFGGSACQRSAAAQRAWTGNVGAVSAGGREQQSAHRWPDVPFSEKAPGVHTPSRGAQLLAATERSNGSVRAGPVERS